MEEFGAQRTPEAVAEARATLGIRPDEFAIGTITRLHDSKGNEYLVEAARLGRRSSSERAVFPGRRRSAPARARGAGGVARAGRSVRVRRLREGRGGDALGVRSQRLPVALGRHAAHGVRGAGRRQADRRDGRRRPAGHPRPGSHRVDRAETRRGPPGRADRVRDRAPGRTRGDGVPAAREAGRSFDINAFVRKMERLYPMLHAVVAPARIATASSTRTSRSSAAGARVTPAAAPGGSPTASARRGAGLCRRADSACLRRLRAVRGLSAHAYGFQSDEATYYMITYSLASDHDLEYRRADLERVWHEFPAGPTGVFLKTGRSVNFRVNAAFPFVHVCYAADPDNARLYFGKSFIYPLVAAPFVWLLGTSGFLFLHAILLALAIFCRATCSSKRACGPIWLRCWRPAFSSPRLFPATSSGPRRSCSTWWW